MAVGLAACTSPAKERIVYRSVAVPIHQPCEPKLEPKPVYPTLVGPVATDIFAQVTTLLAERDLRQARELELEAAVAGCAAKADD